MPKKHSEKITSLTRKMLTELASASPMAKGVLKRAMRQSVLRKQKHRTAKESHELQMLGNKAVELHRRKKDRRKGKGY